jgi:glutathionyl-hydroquinone reductase
MRAMLVRRHAAPARAAADDGAQPWLQVYVVYFKTNKKFIHEYPNLKEFTREMFQMPGVHESVNIWHIKTHYFTSHPKLNTYAIVPVGCDAWWEEPHSRGKTHPVA